VTRSGPLKIMYLADAYETRNAGTEGQLYHLLAGLNETRFHAQLTLLRPSTYVRDYGMPCAVRVLGISKVARLSSMATLFRYAWQLKQEGFDLVHIFLNDSSIAAPPFLKAAGRCVLVSRRDMGFWYVSGILTALRLADRFVDHFVVNSEAVKRVVHEKERVPLERISVIYNGYRPREGNDAAPTVQQFGIPVNSPVVGVVANLRPIKRIDDLILAFANVAQRHPSARLVIVGADTVNEEGRSTRKALEDLASDLGIRETVCFTGSVEDPSALVDGFDVAVLCSESEGFSNAIVEYMQAGKPTICTRTGGNPELVVDGETGFLVEPGDADGLAERIAFLLENPDLAVRLGERAKREAGSRYSLDRMLEQQTALYERLAAQTA
jgi:glycosyltransferase involved in cell wall biosynthesis